MGFHGEMSAKITKEAAETASSAERKPGFVVAEIEAACLRAPDRLAVTSGTRKLNYWELVNWANHLAWKLRELHTGPEQVVALLLPRSPEFVIAALGVWKAGASYLPLDPSHPPARLAFTIQDANARIVLTLPHLANHLSVPGVSIVNLDFDCNSSPEAVEPLEINTAPENLAYVIYTSGSTGQPKGVAVEHASLANLVRWHREVYEISQTDRCTWLANPAFDASVWEVWACLATGASAVATTAPHLDSRTADLHQLYAYSPCRGGHAIGAAARRRLARVAHRWRSVASQTSRFSVLPYFQSLWPD